MRIHKAKPEHKVVYTDLISLVYRHADNVTAIEILAIAANMVGKMIALQDQTVTTAEIAMKIVILNLQTGNQEILDQLTKTSGQA